MGSPVAISVPTLSVQRRGSGIGHSSFSFTWSTAIRGPSRVLPLWACPRGGPPVPALPTGLTSASSYTFVHCTCLASLPARTMGLPSTSRYSWVRGEVPNVLPHALSFLCCHVPQQPPGVAFDPRQWKGSQQQLEGEAKDWGGGAASPQPHLCVDADGSNGRDLEIVTCKGRQGGPVWYRKTHSAGVLPPEGVSAALCVLSLPQNSFELSATAQAL